MSAVSAMLVASACGWMLPAAQHTMARQRPLRGDCSAVTACAIADDDAEALISKTKAFMAKGNGFYSKAEPDLFADDFAFAGEIIGPVGKANYIENLDYFQLYEAFADLTANAASFSIDARNPRRVWLITRVTGTHVGSVPIPFGLGLQTELAPTGSQIAGGPECFSVTWDRNGRVKMLTVGYVVSNEGTNGGFGAAFGLLHGCGVSPALLRWVKNNIELVLWANQLVRRLDGKIPLARSFDKDLPAWWPEYKRTGICPT